MTSMPLDGMPSLPTTANPLGSPPTSSDSPLPNPLLFFQEEKQKKEIASWVENQWVACKNARVPFERQWYLNLAFYSGRHYVNPVDVAGQGFRLVAPKAPPWRVRMVINKIRTAIRRETAKLTSGKPIPVVLPKTTEDEDYTAARIAEALLKSEFSNHDFEKKYRSFVWWGSMTGTSFMKSYWNPSMVDYGASPQDPQPNPISPHLPPIVPPPVTGKICIERVTPFHIYVPDLLAEGLEEQPYLIHASTRSVESLQKMFPSEKFTPDSRASNTIMESAVLMTKGSNEHLDSVLVKEVWIKPGSHPHFPEGGVVTVANSRVIQWVKKWPYPFTEFPFYKFDGIPTGGFYGDSVIVDLIPVQKEYNKKKSQSIEIMNTMGKPKLLYQKGAVNPRQISSEPGQGIPYTPGFERPTVIPGVDVPASFSNELQQLLQDFDDISGQHEISRGTTPPQVTSGTAIAFLQEQDDTMLSYQVASLEHCIELLGKHYLEYVLKYWDDARIIKITGKDGSFEVQHWKGSNLQGNTDVQVQAGSGLPNSKAAKQAMVTEFMTNGWLDPATGMEILELGGLDKALNELLVDKRQAQRENLKMASLDAELIQMNNQPPVGPDGQPMVDPATGQPIDPMTGMPVQRQPLIKPNSWDNHEAHIHYHNQFRKTQEFELLDDGVKQEFELHVQAHQMATMLPMQGANGNIVSQPSSMMGPPPGEEGGMGDPVAAAGSSPEG